MREYEFSLKFRLPDQSDNPADYVDALAEAGCDDALIGIGRPGYLSLEFIRESESANEALRSALADVYSAVKGAELIEASPDYVGLTDVAEVLNVSRQYIRKLAQDNYSNFPAPIHFGTAALYNLYDILIWVSVNKKRDIDSALFEITAYNKWLNLTNQFNRIQSAGLPNKKSRLAEIVEDMPKDVREIIKDIPIAAGR